jgi:hypothetical protein
MRAAPYVARLQTEIGLLANDQAQLEAGLRGLEALGELEQPGRIRARISGG